ncbi:Translation machinery-associated protein 16 [Psilocybe cubensis]|uniref:Translation machinery-associated protein 16 n=2 Tax=Psilocybe cubensis TaxID=181762 RepID=A0ACB8GUP4_PSICU|nr:Translation machinery-associated protein 16 [Psilocybe cubensis]KAH9479455.1 Translation machinery-associated protein 16 [Psilocybe cubensis]
MAPASTSKAAAATKKVKKEKLFHPASRKAGQLARHALRKGKLVDLYGFFYHAVPEEGVLTLEELHHIISDVWLTRFDEELEAERSARRKGRPKSAKEMKLEELKLREAEIYRTGMEVIDLTHPPTVELFRRWDQKEVAFIQLLRFIRIFSTDPQLALVSRPGKHLSITVPPPVPDDAMDLAEENEIKFA